MLRCDVGLGDMVWAVRTSGVALREDGIICLGEGSLTGI
jgi:hypothetical protein